MKKNNYIHICVKFLLISFLLVGNIACIRSNMLSNHIASERESLHITGDLAEYGSYLDPIISATSLSKKNAVAVLEQGNDALLARLELIRKAQKSLYIQTFIWKSDETARLLAWELALAAQRGVKVKILIDAFSIPEDHGILKLLVNSSENIELRFYNPVAKSIKPSTVDILLAAGVTFDKFNQRMHNKLFIVDDQISIIGGRNYSNEYFDRGANRIFKDLEVVIIGDVVKEMTDSFTDYWYFENVIQAKDMLGVNKILDSNKVYAQKSDLELYALFDDIENCLYKDKCTAQKFAERYKLVNKVEFVADLPGKFDHLNNSRSIYSVDRFYKFINSAKNNILLQSPYLVVDRQGSRFFRKLIKDKPELDIVVSSNSLAAADHPHAYAFSFKKKKKYLKKFRWRIYEFKPRPQDIRNMIADCAYLTIESLYQITLHAKVYLIDNQRSWVGSFNLDPRSAKLNTEASVIINSKQITTILANNINLDISPQNSWVIAKRNKKLPIAILHGLIYDISKLIPLIDVWPYTYAGCFELKPNKHVVATNHKDFYSNYDYVGPFPEVALSLKEAKARITKAFLGSAEPLI